MNARTQGGDGVRRYGHTPDGQPMKTVKPRFPGRFARSSARPRDGIAATAVPSASRTLRVEPLAPRRARRG
jgi:hypothetical protein